jgi:hypothetical protein
MRLFQKLCNKKNLSSASGRQSADVGNTWCLSSDDLKLAFEPPSSTFKMVSAFFYGTLMHPKIFKRVIQNEGTHLTIAPAALLVSQS